MFLVSVHQSNRNPLPSVAAASSPTPSTTFSVLALHCVICLWWGQGQKGWNQGSMEAVVRSIPLDAGCQ